MNYYIYLYLKTEILYHIHENISYSILLEHFQFNLNIKIEKMLYFVEFKA